MWDGGVLVLRVLLEGFAEAKVRIDRVRVNLDGVLEVLGGALSLTKISKKVGQMDASTKVVLIESEALFEVLHAPLEIFELLVTHASVVESV